MSRLLSPLARIPHAPDLIDSRRPLSALIPVVFALIVLWQGVPAVFDGYKERGTDDFWFLLRAGSVVREEPSSLYKDNIDERRWRRVHRYPFPTWYPYPPGVAFLTAPLTFLTDERAVFAMRVLIALSTIYLAILVARVFSSNGWRLALAAAIVCWEPILLNGKIGQTGVFVALAIALAANVYMRDRLRGAIVFGLIALKPSAAIGPALAVSLSKPRAWLYFAAVGLAVVFLPFVLLGPTAIGEWLRILYDRSAIDLGGGNRYNQGLSSVISFRGIAGVALLVVGGLAVWLAARRVQSRLGLEVATAFAILMGFLLNPHSLLYDWGIAFVAILLLRRSSLVREPYADVVIGVLGVSLFLFGQWAWRSSFGSPLINPLTGWALAVNLVLLALTFHPGLARTRSPATEPVPVPT